MLIDVLMYVHYLQLKLLQDALIFERLCHSRDQILYEYNFQQSVVEQCGSESLVSAAVLSVQ